jgi:membrane associated rhomboid family serine protease
MQLSLTIIIIAITCIVSYLALNNASLFHSLKHNPYLEHRDKQYYRMLSCGFVHGSLTHLLVNMYVLYEFGGIVEKLFTDHYGNMGKLVFLLTYLAIIVLANIPSYYSKADQPHYSSVGASGGTSGVIMMFILTYPWSMLLLFFAIPIPAIILGVAYLGYSHWANLNSKDNIDHGAHLWGAIAGIALCLTLLPESLPTFLERIVQIPYIN